MDSMSISAYGRMKQEAIRRTRMVSKATVPKTEIPPQDENAAKTVVVKELEKPVENKKGLNYYA